MIKFILLEFNEKQNAAHYNIFNEKTQTFSNIPNTYNWEPICIFNWDQKKEDKIINNAIKLMQKAKEDKVKRGKEYIDLNIMEFSKESVYWDNIVMRKIRKDYGG